MVQQFKFLLFSLFMFLVTVGYANNIVTPPSTEPETNVCPYLTPTNFQPIAIGSDFVTLAWVQPGAPPPFYNIKAFQVSTGILVYNTTFPNTGTGYTVPVPFPGTEYRFELYPLTANQLSCVPPAVVVVKSVIIELVVYQNTPNYKFEDCVINQVFDPLQNQAWCTFPNDGTPTSFRIQNIDEPENSRVFQLKYVSANQNYKMEIGCNLGGFSFNCTTAPNDPPCGSGEIRILKNGQTAAILRIIGTASQMSPAKLFCTSLLNNTYEIARLPYNNERYCNYRDSDESSEVIFGTELTASPNPFTNQLDIQIPFSTEENDVKISLYDLQGRLVMNQILPGGPQIRNLSTENLLSGLYLLRVDTGNRSETIKVMKTQ